MNDLKMVKALKKGDKNAFKYIFERYYNRLVAYITSFTRDQIKSEDIVQQAFINLWEDRSKLDSNKSPKNYLYSIAYNRYIDSINKSKRRNKLLEEIWKKSLNARIDEDNEITEKRIKKIKQAIDLLPPKCKKILLLNKVEGVKYKDIAIQLGISQKTVESQMRIAFIKIRKAFENKKFILFMYFSKIKKSMRKIFD